MSTFLFLIGFVGFLVCLVLLVIAFIKKKEKKKILIGLAAFFVAFVAGVSISSPSPDTSQSTAEPTKSVVSSEEIDAKAEKEKAEKELEEQKKKTAAAEKEAEKAKAEKEEAEKKAAAEKKAREEAEKKAAEEKAAKEKAAKENAAKEKAAKEKAAKEKAEKEAAEQENAQQETTQNNGTHKLSDAMVVVEGILRQSYGDNYSLDYDDNTVTINVWQEGIAAGVVYANEGNQECIDAWKVVVTGITGLSKNLADQLKELGFDNMTVTVNVVNDLNKEKTLLTTVNGVVVYNAVES